jgi:hypothetical protein
MEKLIHAKSASFSLILPRADKLETAAPVISKRKQRGEAATKEIEVPRRFRWMDRLELVSIG